MSNLNFFDSSGENFFGPKFSEFQNFDGGQILQTPRSSETIFRILVRGFLLLINRFQPSWKASFPVRRGGGRRGSQSFKKSTPSPNRVKGTLMEDTEQGKSCKNVYKMFTFKCKNVHFFKKFKNEL